MVNHGVDGFFHESIDFSCPLQVVKPRSCFTEGDFLIASVCLIEIQVHHGDDECAAVVGMVRKASS